MAELRASIIVNLAGNLAVRARAFEGSVARLGRRGVGAFHGMNRAIAAQAAGLGRLGNRWVALATGGGIAAVGFAASRRAMETEERLARLGVQSKASGKVMDAMWQQAQDSAKKFNLDPKEVLGAVEQIVEKTGDLKFATANMDNLAAAIQATGAGGENIGAIAAEFQKMGLVKPGQVMEALDILNAQGKEGAFTLQNLAGLGPRVFAAYAASGRGGLQAIREMGAALQMIRMGTGSSEQAATAFEALMRTMQDAEKIKFLQAGGIQVFDPEELKKKREVLRPVNELMAEIIRATGGKSTLLSMAFDAEAMRAFTAASGEFLSSGKLQRLEHFFQIKGGGETVSDAERVAKTTGAKLESAKERLMNKAGDSLIPVFQKGADIIEQGLERGFAHGNALFWRSILPEGVFSLDDPNPSATAITRQKMAELNRQRLAEETGAFEAAQQRLRDRMESMGTGGGPSGELEVPHGRVEIEVSAKPGTEARVRKVEGRGVDVSSGIIMQGN